MDEGNASRRSRSRSRSRSPRRNDDSNNNVRMSDRPSRSRSPRSPRSGGSRDDGPPPAEVQNPGNNIYIANLSYKTDERDIEALFATYGKVFKVELIRDPLTQESRGFGFVSMVDNRDADDAIQALAGQDIEGRPLRVEMAKRKVGHAKTPGQYLGVGGGSKFRDDRRGGGGYRRDRSSDRRDYRRGGGDRGYDDRQSGGYRGGNDRGYDDRREHGGRGGYDDRRGGGDRGYDDRRGGGDRDRRERSPRRY